MIPVVKFSFPPQRGVVVRDGRLSPKWPENMVAAVDRHRVRRVCLYLNTIRPRFLRRVDQFQRTFNAPGMIAWPQRGVVVRDGRLSPKWPENMAKRSQDLEPLYHDCGQFYCLNISIKDLLDHICCRGKIIGRALASEKRHLPLSQCGKTLWGNDESAALLLPDRPGCRRCDQGSQETCGLL